MRAPNVRLTTRQSEPLSAKARERFRAWVARHIVADDLYNSEHLEQVGTDERTPYWTSLGLVLMMLSAFVSLVSLIIFWAWLAG